MVIERKLMWRFYITVKHGMKYCRLEQNYDTYIQNIRMAICAFLGCAYGVVLSCLV